MIMLHVWSKSGVEIDPRLRDRVCLAQHNRQELGHIAAEGVEQARVRLQGQRATVQDGEEKQWRAGD